MISEERRTLEQICDELRSSGEITRSQWNRLKNMLGERFIKAWQLIEQKRIKKYIFKPSNRVIWVAIGIKSEYQILPTSGYCDCSDFYFRVIDQEIGFCYHLLSQRLAEALKTYDEVHESDEFYEELMMEWRILSAKLVIN